MVTRLNGSGKELTATLKDFCGCMNFEQKLDAYIKFDREQLQKL
jgi:hypothetical protein